MRQPVGLYLAEFTPSEGVAALVRQGGLPRFDVCDETEGPGLQILGVSDPIEADPPFEDAEATPADEAAELAPSAPPVDAPEITAVIAAIQADHAAALESARQQWAEQEGAALATGLATALAELETRIADTLAPLLEPFLVQAAQLQALAQLRATLGTLLDSPEGAVTISGPADLLAALRPACGNRAGLVFTETGLPDVTVTMGDTRIQSQLAGWARALEAALDMPA